MFRVYSKNNFAIQSELAPVFEQACHASCVVTHFTELTKNSLNFQRSGEKGRKY